MSGVNSEIKVKIAYIGGGSRGWAHIMMNDLAQCPELHGEVFLYDIDLEAARLNQAFGSWIQRQDGVRSRWQYHAVETLQEALAQADFVATGTKVEIIEIHGNRVVVRPVEE